MTLVKYVANLLAPAREETLMREYGVLTCPVCSQHYVSSDTEVTDRKTLKAIAREHLLTHNLDESKRGIYGVSMVKRMQRRAGNTSRTPRNQQIWAE